MSTFRYTKAIDRLRYLSKRVRVVQGGTGAGKTYGIIPILIDYAVSNPGKEISCVSESVPHLRKGVVKDFVKIMSDTGKFREDDFNRTFLTYYFENGSYMEFFSVDQEQKIRGPRRNVLYINECNNVDFETYFQLAIRTSDIIWLDYNPTGEFWVHTELKEDDDTEKIVLTYKDNEALPDSIVREIEKSKDRAFHNSKLEEPDIWSEENIKSVYWLNWWRVFGLGELGVLEGAIFTEWEQTRSIPKEAALIGYGMDFGYTNDPTAVVCVYKYNQKYILDELLYEKGMTNDDIGKWLKRKGIPTNSCIIADSSEPKSIAEINRYGYHIFPAMKGPDSIMFGIGVLQQYKYLVTTKSTNLIKELRTYCWDKDKDGKVINRPATGNDHAIDALRYLAMSRMTKRRRSGIRLVN